MLLFDYKSVNFNAKITDTDIDCDVMSPLSPLLSFRARRGRILGLCHCSCNPLFTPTNRKEEGSQRHGA